MTTYNTASKQLLNNYACISTLEPTEIVIGQSVIVASIGAPFNGTFTVLALPQYLFIGADTTTGELLFNENISVPNQILYACTGSDVQFIAFYTGTVTYTQICTWIADADLLAYLGVEIDEESDDYVLLEQSVLASNAFCYRRRQESNYFDQLNTSPGGDVTLGTLMYGAALWRSRGSLENAFASFDTMGQAPQQSLTPIVKQLLGINRPSVA